MFNEICRTLNNSFWLSIIVPLPSGHMGKLSTARGFHSGSFIFSDDTQHLVSFDLILQSQISYRFYFRKMRQKLSLLRTHSTLGKVHMDSM